MFREGQSWYRNAGLGSAIGDNRVMSNPRTKYLDEVMKFSAKLSAELAGLFGISSQR